MPSPDESLSQSDPEILAARGKVELAKAELESRIYQAGDTGKRALKRMARKAIPVVAVAGAILGVVVVVRLVTRTRHKSVWQRYPAATDSRTTPLVKVALGAAVRGALRVLLARVAEQAAARLVAANEEQEREPETGLPTTS
jgi:uncharacterized integral membrane protein